MAFAWKNDRCHLLSYYLKAKTETFIAANSDSKIGVNLEKIIGSCIDVPNSAGHMMEQLHEVT